MDIQVRLVHLEEVMTERGLMVCPIPALPPKGDAPMDAESSFQVLLFTAALTMLLIGAIRVMGILAASNLPDRVAAPKSHPSHRGTLDPLRLLAILTAAAMEELESDEIFLSSIVELPEPGGPKHWPRVGKMRFFQKSQYRH
jgi:Na+-transporting methylmalonyl-CoA/oxaloacetate decarboxylase gamma subunit